MRKHELPAWVGPAACVCAAYGMAMLIVAMFTGQWVTRGHFYYSYTLQAVNWLNGRLDIANGEDYAWLELAIRDGRYYVSFPPFPSYVLLPFAAICGMDTPDAWIALFFAMLSCVYAVRLYIAMTGGTRHLLFFVLFLLLGNGYLYLTMNGWVWFIAQNMCMALSLMALYYACVGKGGVSFALWACAVGCRPMTALYFPLLAWLAVRRWKQRDPSLTLWRLVRRKWYWAILPVLIGGSYMVLNWLRFGNVLEFGHNYLPEFTRTTTGQFNICYFWRNVLTYLELPEWQGSWDGVSFTGVDGCAFYLVNPFFLTAAAAWGWALVKKRDRNRAMLVLLPVLLLAQAAIICLHKTLGGVQFGNRYLVDLLPFAFTGLLLWKPDSDRFVHLSAPLAVMGTAVNLIGTVMSYNNLL